MRDHLVGAAKQCLQHKDAASAAPTSVPHRCQPNLGTLEGISMGKNFKFDAVQLSPRKTWHVSATS